MSRPDDPVATNRVGAYLGQPVRDRDGALLGQVADLVTEPDAEGRERVVAVVVVRGPWGRLLGYERAEHTGPWLLQRLARAILRRDMRRVAWPDATIEPGWPDAS
jgi:hypothetical protein